MKPKFLNFPLIVLAYGTNERERLETLAQWAIIDVGFKSYRHWRRGIYAGNADELMQAVGRIRTLIAKHDIDADELLETCTDELAWALGVETLGIHPKWMNAATCLAGHRRLSEFIKRMQTTLCRGDKHPVPVRGLRVDWFMAALRPLWDSGPWDGKRLGFGHFAVLCALLSKIGTNEPPAKACGCYEIQRRSMGYGTAEEMRLALPYRQDDAKPMSRDMIDRRTKQLALGGFLYRHTPMIGGKALVAWYGLRRMSAAAFVQIAETAKVKAKGGWKARYKAQQAAQTAMHDNIIAFEAAGRDSRQPRIGGERTA